MKILHTSDIHLARNHPERLEALDRVLEAAATHEVDYLIVGGDLFDTHREAEHLRVELRERFSGTPFQVLIVSGNHDQDSYPVGRDYGARARIFGGDEPEFIDTAAGRLVFQPYTGKPFGRLAPSLTSLVHDSLPSVLVLHCTLDFPDLEAGSFGEEGGGRYLPVSSGLLRELGYKYILAGHFHRRYSQRDLGGGTAFVYPGSPVSVTRAETGRRSACLLNLESGTMNQLELDTFHQVYLEKKLEPGQVAQGLDVLEREVDKRSHPLASMEVYVHGYVDLPESDVRQRLSLLQGWHQGLTLKAGYVDISQALDHPLYEKFAHRMRSMDLEPGEMELLKNEFLGVLCDYLSAGR